MLFDNIIYDKDMMMVIDFVLVTAVCLIYILHTTFYYNTNQDTHILVMANDMMEK